MFFFKFSFVLTILAFMFMSAAALPVAFTGNGGAPGSLLGRTYVQRASSAVTLAAREETVAAPARRAPVAVEDPESFVPMKRSERFQRRITARGSRLAGSDFDVLN